jgi:hypothetical protein
MISNFFFAQKFGEQIGVFDTKHWNVNYAKIGSHHYILSKKNANVFAENWQK